MMIRKVGEVPMSSLDCRDCHEFDPVMMIAILIFFIGIFLLNIWTIIVAKRAKIEIKECY